MCEAGKARSSLPRRRLQIITQALALLQSAGGLRVLLNGLYVMRRVSASCVLGLLCRSSRSGKARVGLVASSASYADHRGAGRRASASLRRLAIPGPIPLRGSLGRLLAPLLAIPRRSPLREGSRREARAANTRR